MTWAEGRPISDAPKDGSTFLALDTDGQFRLIFWTEPNWTDDEYRRVSPVKWWPLPKAEGVAR